MNRRDVIKGQGELEDRLQYISSNTVNSDPLTPEGRSKRNFLKYAVPAALVLALGGAAAWYHFCYKPGQNSPPGTTTPTTRRTTGVNYPPQISKIMIKPQTILPTTEYLIQLSNDAYDPDGDPLTYKWSIDHKEVGREPSFSIKLPEGYHWVDCLVSDGREERGMGASVTVELDQIYTEKRPLYMKEKGTSYYVGNIMPEGPNVFPSEEEMYEQLDTIHNDLGCNAIIITGGDKWEDKIIRGSEMAIKKGFDRVYVQPRYVNYTPDETVKKIGEFAPKVRSLREKYGEVVAFCVGHEFLFETVIIRGGGFFERWKNGMTGADVDKIKQTLPEMFKEIIAVCKKNYGYPITYAATPYEAYENLVPWSDPTFEAIGVDTYITEVQGIMNDENWWFNLFSRLKKVKKPIISFDWGMMSYENADKWGGLSPLYAGNYPYDEEPQVRYIVRTLNMLNQARITGCHWVDYNDVYAAGHGLYNPITLERKKGFYMLKSHEIVNTN